MTISPVGALSDKWRNEATQLRQAVDALARLGEPRHKQFDAAASMADRHADELDEALAAQQAQIQRLAEEKVHADTRPGGEARFRDDATTSDPATDRGGDGGGGTDCDSAAEIRAFLVHDCGMHDIGTTRDMVRGVAYRLKRELSNLAAQQAAITAIRPVVDAARGLLAQFQAIQQHQHGLLVEGQTLDSAAHNWDEATLGLSVDFQPLIDALAALDALQGEVTCVP